MKWKEISVGRIGVETSRLIPTSVGSIYPGVGAWRNGMG